MNPKKNMARYFDIFCEIQDWVELEKVPAIDNEYTCRAEETFDEEMFLDWQGHRIHFFTLPGHSIGSSGIVIDDSEFFSGDSVMEYEAVELRFPGSSAKLWKEVAVPRLKMLHDGLHVNPGHFEEFILRKGC